MKTKQEIKENKVLIAIDENYVNMNDISVITNVKCFNIRNKVCYAFYVILKSGKEIEVCSTDKSSLEEKRIRIVIKISEVED